MKTGYTIFDADSHVSEPPEIIEKYIDRAYLDRLLRWKVPGTATYRPNQIGFQRRLGREPGSEDAKPVTRAAVAPRHRQPPKADTNTNPVSRLQDMDQEGIDAGLILPTGVGSFCSVEDSDLEMEVIKAYHRFMSDYCGAASNRLFGVAVVSARNVAESVKELERVCKERWPAAIFPSVPPRMPLDAPSLDPLWAAANDLGLAVALHTFTVIPPYAPGALDGSFFDNYWLARAAAHPWCGMRNMAALLGSGVLDRHKKLTISLLEAGQAWLPYWVTRLDEQAEYAPFAVPEGMRSIRDCVQSGRYFQSIEMHEGEAMTRFVVDQLGPDILMFSSDYPHGETWFPDTVDTFLGWKSFPEAMKKKILWDNALRCYPRIAA